MAPNSDNIAEWVFLIGGLDSPFEFGEYIFVLTAPPTFPQSPPTLQFYTKNGVFTPGGRICISIGEFHANDRPGKDGAHGWRPGLGMLGFANQVVNALLCYETLDSGIRINKEPDSVKINLAKSSRVQNLLQYPSLMTQLEDIIAQYPNAEPIKNILRSRAKFDSECKSIGT